MGYTHHYTTVSYNTLESSGSCCFNFCICRLYTSYHTAWCTKQRNKGREKIRRKNENKNKNKWKWKTVKNSLLKPGKTEPFFPSHIPLPMLTKSGWHRQWSLFLSPTSSVRLKQIETEWTWSSHCVVKLQRHWTLDHKAEVSNPSMGDNLLSLSLSLQWRIHCQVLLR